MSQCKRQNCRLTAANIAEKCLSLIIQLSMTVNIILLHQTAHFLSLGAWQHSVQRAILRRIWHAPGLYKFASLVIAAAPVVMKYNLFSGVLLFNMQGLPGLDRGNRADRVYQCYKERVRVSNGLTPCIYDQRMLTTGGGIFRLYPHPCLFGCWFKVRRWFQDGFPQS